ncbi:MAG: hypothetical protein K1060chlam5_00848 [Candidatus Anoxychlamydiales bacterium]|nr:hypothetical protein [Candidatus Anoxychlamydiales bacterium]
MKRLFFIFFMIFAKNLFPIDFFISFEELEDQIKFNIQTIEKQNSIRKILINDFEIIQLHPQKGIMNIYTKFDKTALMAVGFCMGDRLFNKNLFQRGIYKVYINDDFMGELNFENDFVNFSNNI